jgi:RNase H-like domain found in reverse transcriptase
MQAVIQLRPYLEGQRFIIRTDHHSLRWVLNLADAQGRLARWHLRLLEFDYEVQYSPGRIHHGADTMSRLKPADATPSEKSVDTASRCNLKMSPNLLLLIDFVTSRRKTQTINVLLISYRRNLP